MCHAFGLDINALRPNILAVMDDRSPMQSLMGKGILVLQCLASLNCGSKYGANDYFLAPFCLPTIVF